MRAGRRAALIGILACVPGVRAQLRPMAELAVTVRDTSGAAVPGAAVTATNRATGGVFMAKTDGNGGARLALDRGTYGLAVVETGFQPYQAQVNFSETSAESITLLVDMGGPSVAISPISPGITIPDTSHPVVGALLPYKATFSLPFPLKLRRVRATRPRRLCEVKNALRLR
jgi:hypothetical protein